MLRRAETTAIPTNRHISYATELGMKMMWYGSRSGIRRVIYRYVQVGIPWKLTMTGVKMVDSLR